MLFESEQPSAEAPESAAAPATPSAAPAAPAAPADSAQTDTETDALGTDLDQEAPDPDEAEEELEGVKLKGKKELLERLKSERLMHGDYTRKTQTLAQDRETLKAEREGFQQQTQLQQQLIREVAQVTALDERLAQFQKLDWNAVIAQDAAQAQRLQIEFSQLQAARGQLVGSLTQKQQQMQFMQQQEIAKRTNEAQAFLMREFKDWSPEKDRQLEAYARSEGIDTRALGGFLLHNPAIAKALDKAMKWDLAAKKRAERPVPAPAPKPISRVGGVAASNTKAPSDMTPTEYAKWRQERKKR